MNNLERLIQKANEKGCRLLIRYDPSQTDEEWGIKFYISDDDAHFFAYHEDLEIAARKLLNELKGFKSW